jgi:hypothetical protein
LIARLVLALYLISSALAQYDARPLNVIETMARLGLAALVMFKLPVIYGAAIVAALVLIGWHYLGRRGRAAA